MPPSRAAARRFAVKTVPGAVNAEWEMPAARRQEHGPAGRPSGWSGAAEAKWQHRMYSKEALTSWRRVRELLRDSSDLIAESKRDHGRKSATHWGSCTGFQSALSAVAY